MLRDCRRKYRHHIFVGPSLIVLIFSDGIEVVSGDGVAEIRSLLEACMLDDLGQIVKKHAEKRECLSIRAEEVYHSRTKLPSKLSERIISFANYNLSYSPLFAFLKKLRANPAAPLQESVYAYLETMGMPILENGNFLAYVRVRHDYTDWKTGKTKVRTGKSDKMKRDRRNKDRYVECVGLAQASSWIYCPSKIGGGIARVMEVEVSPECVTHVPANFDEGKLLVNKWKVLREVLPSLAKANRTKEMYDRRHKESKKSVAIYWGKDKRVVQLDKRGRMKVCRDFLERIGAPARSKVTAVAFAKEEMILIFSSPWETPTVVCQWQGKTIKGEAFEYLVGAEGDVKIGTGVLRGAGLNKCKRVETFCRGGVITIQAPR